jgi:hypothetical protein
VRSEQGDTVDACFEAVGTLWERFKWGSRMVVWRMGDYWVWKMGDYRVCT